MHTSGVSDHTCVAANVSLRTVSSGAKPIPEYIFRSHYFEIFHDKLVKEANIQSLDYPDRLIAHKEVIRAAAKLARDKLQDSDEDNPMITSMRFSTLSRIVWSQDFDLAKKLLSSSDLARRWLVVSRHAITLNNPNLFSREMDAAKLKALQQQSMDHSGSPRKFNSSRGAQLARLSRIWVKIDKQLQLSGVRVDGEIIRSEPQKTIALGASWQATFNPKPYDVAAADTLLAQSGDIGEYEDVPPTTIFDYMEAHGIGKNGSRPGPDGIPYVAWASAGPVGDDTLYTTDKSIRNGREPPPNFNESGISFIPKGEEEADPVEIIRNANDNRPISTKNTDNKVIIAVNTYKLKDRYSANTTAPKGGL